MVRPAATTDWASTWPPKTRPCGCGWLRPTKTWARDSPRSVSASPGSPSTEMLSRAELVEVEHVEEVGERIEAGGVVTGGHSATLANG